VTGCHYAVRSFIIKIRDESGKKSVYELRSDQEQSGEAQSQKPDKK